ncbi:transposase [Kribbella shirazensis]|uniref:Transposase n=1 Tax=Kribbella shirazensis TaxID=1105143 RepID=A0A7X5V4C4_9ACTN|nr:transposase [Kribbella shirazensis]
MWNLGLEQRLMWRPARPATPGYVAQCAQLTEARAAEPWLKAGSQTVQQQALRDLDQAWRNFYAGTHGRPTWRCEGVHEGFRVVGMQAQRVEKLNRKWGRVLVPKVGWVKFRLSRKLPEAKSYRVTRDRAGRWHIAFAVIAEPIRAPGNGVVVGVDRGVTVSAALSTGEMLSCPGLSRSEQRRVKRLQRKLARAKRGSNRRGKIRAAIARFKARESDRRKNWVEQTTTNLARLFDVIGVEDLRIRGMTKSARGTRAAPGAMCGRRPSSTEESSPRVGACSFSVCITRRRAGSRRSILRTRRRPAAPVGTSQRRTARAKRCSGASPVGTRPTPT